MNNSDSNIPIRLLTSIILISIIFSAIFSAFETSLTSADRIKVKLKANKGSTIHKRIYGLIKNYSRTISSILIFINASHALYASLISYLIAYKYGERYLSIGILISGFIIFLVGEMLPKVIAVIFKGEMLTITSFFCMPILSVVLPLSDILYYISNGIINLLKTKKNNEGKISEDVLKSMMETALKTGNIDIETKKLIDSALSFDDKTVGSIMTSWDKVNKIYLVKDSNNYKNDSTLNLYISNTDEFIQKIENLRYSRFPILNENNKLLGIINIKLFLQDYLRSNKKSNIYSSIISPFFIKPQIKTDDCLSLLSTNKTHLAFVKNKIGEIIGIITIEDIIEELIGDIDDEKTIRRGK